MTDTPEAVAKRIIAPLRLAWNDNLDAVECEIEAEIERLRAVCKDKTELLRHADERLRARPLPSVDALAWTIGENMHGNSKQIAEAVLALMRSECLRQ